MKRVILDVDGVSADFVMHTLNTLVRVGGPQHVSSDIKTWNIWDSLPREWEDRVTAEWHRPGWCSTIPLYEGSREGVLSLRDYAEVLFVTTAMDDAPHWLWERDQWLRHHLKAGSREIIFAVSKHAVTGTVFVDDKTPNVLEWHKHNPNGVAVLWDRSYNQNDVLPEGVIRTKSWEQVVQLVSRSA